MNEETLLLGFKCISTFVAELESVFGSKNKALRLYKRLISKTQITHDQAVNKHFNLFKNFCFKNREAILEKNVSKIVDKKVEYSERVYIDFGFIFNNSESDVLDVIWNHLLTISAIVDPLSRAKEILKNNKIQTSEGEEEDFLLKIMNKLEGKINPETNNPMEAVSGILQSGILNELMSDIGSKKMDLGKLLGSVQKLVGKMGNEMGDSDDSKNTMNMINTMMGTLGNMGNGNGNGTPPDMMAMATTLLGTLGNTSTPLEIKSDPKVEQL